MKDTTRLGGAYKEGRNSFEWILVKLLEDLKLPQFMNPRRQSCGPYMKRPWNACWKF
jgi:hypothetical protein